MDLLKDNNRVYEFIKGLFGLLGIRLVIGLIIFSLGMFSFCALVIPSVKNIILIFSSTSLLNIKNYILISIDGCFLGLLFGFILNIIYCLKNSKNKIENIPIIKGTEFASVLFFSCLIGIIISFFNKISGLYGILDIIQNKENLINKETPVGQILDYWGVYNNNSEDGNILPWLSFIILTILIVIMDIIIGIFISGIIGLIFSFIKIKNRIYLEDLTFCKNDCKTNISKEIIIFFSIISYIKKYIFISGLMGLLYGIIGSILMYIMIKL
jgi:hypothetical protein